MTHGYVLSDDKEALLRRLKRIEGQVRGNSWSAGIAVTTRGDEASRARALGAGASAFMTKPFTPEAILVEVRGMLARMSEAHG